MSFFSFKKSTVFKGTRIWQLNRSEKVLYSKHMANIILILLRCFTVSTIHCCWSWSSYSKNIKYYTLYRGFKWLVHTVCCSTAIMHWWHTCPQSDGPLALRVVVSWRRMMLVLVGGFHFPGLKTVEEGETCLAVSWCANANNEAHTSSYLHWVWHTQGHVCHSYSPRVLAHLQTQRNTQVRLFCSEMTTCWYWGYMQSQQACLSAVTKCKQS